MKLSVYQQKIFKYGKLPAYKHAGSFVINDRFASGVISSEVPTLGWYYFTGGLPYNSQDKNPDGSPKAFDAPGQNYDGFAYYGELADEESWSIFVNSIMPDLRPGDIIGYHNMNSYRNDDADPHDFNHVATVVGFARNPDQGNAMWPLVVDVSGSVTDQPHFLDASPSLDIHEVIVIFVGR